MLSFFQGRFLIQKTFLPESDLEGNGERESIGPRAEGRPYSRCRGGTK